LADADAVREQQVGLREPGGATGVAATAEEGVRAASGLDHRRHFSRQRDALVDALTNIDVGAHGPAKQAIVRAVTAEELEGVRAVRLQRTRLQASTWPEVQERQVEVAVGVGVGTAILV